MLLERSSDFFGGMLRKNESISFSAHIKSFIFSLMRKILSLLLGSILFFSPLFVSAEASPSDCETHFSDILSQSFLPTERIFISNNFFLVKKQAELTTTIAQFADDIQSYSGICSTVYQNILRSRLMNMQKMNETIGKTLEFRRNPIYHIPVLGGYINPSFTALPNASRSYRASSTDGIHHGIDFYGNYGTSVISASDGVVIRIVSGFQTSWFDRITTGANLSELEKSKNLDVYRGNQVWILAPDGTVATYAHLSELSDTLFIGKAVAIGETLGKI